MSLPSVLSPGRSANTDRLAYPGCLQRAGEQSWGWEQGSDEIQQHHAHIRLLISYVLGVEEAEEDDEEVPLVPDDYDALEELTFLTRAVAAVLEMPRSDLLLQSRWRSPARRQWSSPGAQSCLES